jgi:hypothetical protein
MCLVQLSYPTYGCFSPINRIVEQAVAVKFFAIFADNVPVFRNQVLSPTGLPLLIQNIKNLSTEIDKYDIWTSERLCSALAENSQFQWCIPILIQLDICPPLVKLLMYAEFLIDTKPIS